MNLCDNDLWCYLIQPCELSLGCFLARGLILDGYCLLVSSCRLSDTLSYPFLLAGRVECLFKLLVLLAAAPTTKPFLLEFKAFISCLYCLPVLCMYWLHESISWLHIPHCSRQVWSLTTLAWESLRLGLGRDWTPSVIFRTLSPICILFVVGGYLFLPLLFGSLYYISCILDSFESSCIYLFCCCCGIFVNCCNVITSGNLKSVIMWILAEMLKSA